MEAAIGGGFIDPGSQAGPQQRNNLPHLRFTVRRRRRHGAKRGRLAVEGNISEETAGGAAFSRWLADARAPAGAASRCRENDGERPEVAAGENQNTDREGAG